jgi:predicted thioesterase
MALADVLSSAKTSAMSPPLVKASDRTRSRTSGSIREVSVTGGIVIVVPNRSSELPTAVGHGPHTGLSAQVELTVGESDTAQWFRSGDVPVLATPRLIALCEEASVRATDGHLTSAQSSVATRVQFDHLAPVAVGKVVLAEATLVKVEGRRLIFTVSAARLEHDGGGLVGAGRVTRVLVDEVAFLAKAGAAGTP